MSFASDITQRYRRNGVNMSLTGTRLTYKSKSKSSRAQKPDITGHVRKLINAERPKFAQELSQFAHHITLKHNRTKTVIESRLKKELDETQSTQNMRLIRLEKKLSRESQQRYEELINKQELIIAKISSATVSEPEIDTGYIQPGDRNTKFRDVDKMLDKRLNELNDQLSSQISSTAKHEAEKAIQKAREEDKYNRMRGGI